MTLALRGAGSVYKRESCQSQGNVIKFCTYPGFIGKIPLYLLYPLMAEHGLGVRGECDVKTGRDVAMPIHQLRLHL
jgi:hypothetical protein